MRYLYECDDNKDDSVLLSLINDICGSHCNGVELIDDNGAKDGERILCLEVTTDVNWPVHGKPYVHTIKHRFDLPVCSYYSLQVIAHLVYCEVCGIEGNLFAPRYYGTTK